MLQRGFLYWASLDKRRPILVISTDARNRLANDVLVVPCSTTLRAAPTHVFLRAGEGGIPRACVLKCEQLTTLPQLDVEGEAFGPPLSPARIAEVERAVLRAIGVAVSEPS